MKKHTTYYIIGAVLVGAGVYLYSQNKKANTANLTPPKEVEEETAKVPETATAPYVSAYESLKKIIESLKLKKATSTTVTTNTAV